jgi:hypothetical protein
MSPLCAKTCRWISLSGATLLALLATGCSSFDLKKEVNALTGKEPKPQVPVRVSDMWTDTVLQQTGTVPVRGFGGRIMFYNDKDKTVVVEGTLTVYAFEGSDDDPVHTLPERKFVFTPEQLRKHRSESKLGHSYSVWLPWDEVGGRQRELKLVTRFESTSGEMVMSNPSRQILPGMISPEVVAMAKARKGSAGKPAPASGVRQVSHEAPLAEPAASGGMSTTLTLDVPPSFAQHTTGGAENQPNTANAPAPKSAEGGAYAGGVTAAEPARAKDPTQESAADSPSAGYAQRRFPARRAPSALPKHDPVRRQPLPGSWPSALPPTPRQATSTATPESPATGESK